ARLERLRRDDALDRSMLGVTGRHGGRWFDGLGTLRPRHWRTSRLYVQFDMRVLGFDWDESNRSKLRLHGLKPDDVEALFDVGDPYIFRHPQLRGRHIALGFVPDDRFVLVVFE